MSTNAHIAVPIGDDNYKMVYLHCDGYPEYAQNVLNHFYTDPKIALELVSNGPLSVLGAEIGSQIDFGDRGNGKITIPDCRYRIANQCCFYHRDRGDDITGSDIFSLDTILDHFAQNTFVYMYIEETKRWRLL